MDSIEAEMTEIIDRFQSRTIATPRPFVSAGTISTRPTRRCGACRGPPIRSSSSSAGARTARGRQRDEVLDRVIETPARSVAAIAIKLRFALNHGRLLDEAGSVEADADIVLSALRDAERLAARLP